MQYRVTTSFREPILLHAVTYSCEINYWGSVVIYTRRGVDPLHESAMPMPNVCRAAVYSSSHSEEQ